MKKKAVTLMSVIFILFVSINAYPSEMPSNQFSLSKSSAFSVSKLNEEFSLMKNYEIATINTPFFDFEKTTSELAQARRRGKKFSNPEEIRQEIKVQKKKKTSSLIASVGFLGLGSALVYAFLTYEETTRVSQEGVTQRGGAEQENTSVLRRMSLFGGILSGVLSAVLLNDAIKRAKTIRSYEKELKKFAEEQNKITR